MDYILRVTLILGLLSVVAGAVPRSESVSSNQTLVSARQGREFPFHAIGRIANTLCTGTSGLSGTCQIRGECAANGGIASGSCSTLTTQAVCCVYISTCGGSGSNNVTYFQNSGYPTPYNGGTSCTYTVVPPDSTVCQLRVDFSAFTLAQPNADGVCTVDNIVIAGGSSPVPAICGDNNGQHVYVAFSGTSSITVTVSTTSSTSFNRVWNLQLSLISCTSAYQAPAGCLQYYLDSSGTVQSFNYGTAANAALNSLGMIGTRQLASQNYAICIRAGAGLCSITYSLPSGDNTAFTLTGDATSVSATNLGTAAVGEQGTACTTDFLIIPNPSGVNNDRFCGLGIATTTSLSTPFVLYYITDANDSGDVANRGFSFIYSQNTCPIASGK
ncbi:uncharacterized protein LOC134210998 [Armigeres subalbatus]|uniref:uncharacterized protein LOC134210998 n=1 Tax=Armigeres subalbatus TaxID=124917 RepID=UPI002ED3426B